MAMRCLIVACLASHMGLALSDVGPLDRPPRGNTTAKGMNQGFSTPHGLQSSYRLFPNAQSWNIALKNCQDWEAHLFIVEDWTELKILQDTYFSQLSTMILEDDSVPLNMMHAGYVYQYDPNIPKTIFGGNPYPKDNQDGSTKGECSVMRNDGKLMRIDCVTKYMAYLCEKCVMMEKSFYEEDLDHSLRF